MRGVTYTMRLVVEPAAIDEMEHVNNAVYVEWIEVVSRAHPESVGLSTSAFLGFGGVFVARRHEIDYFAPAFLGDEIELRTRILEHRGPRTVREVEIWRGDTRLVRARTEWAWIDPVTRRPKRVPAEIVARLAPDLA